ncbi:hypothetical protein EVAR_88603_1 [Eumeta japonica]|uniref:Uncharacterized protein n=1 Tax=Eumeta variegata TaxID=151549 RepID=A0A4C2A7B0_EUMVA|nr:hypothetical protein EVAR_88603_1 [Eumeta japonica]
MEGICPTHQAFWKVTRALKSKGYLPTPSLKKPDRSLAVDDQEKAECIADSIELQYSHTLPPHDSQHITLIEKKGLNGCRCGGNRSGRASSGSRRGGPTEQRYRDFIVTIDATARLTAGPKLLT